MSNKGILNKALMLLCLFGLSISTVPAIKDSQTNGNPYVAINKRNAFDLANEPPSRKENSPPPEPRKDLDLKFTGIFRLKGVEKACLAVIDTSAKPPETNYFQIPAGDKQGAIEIKSIDAKAGLVQLFRNGKLIELNLSNDEHTYKTAVAKTPSKSKSTSRSSSSKSSSSRTSSSRSSSSSPRSSTSSTSRGAVSNSRSVPSRSSNSMRSVPMRGGATNQNPPVIQQDRDPAVQAIEMVQQKQEAESVGVPMPPLPFQKDIEGQGPVPPPLPGQGPVPPPLPGQGPVPPIPPGR